MTIERITHLRGRIAALRNERDAHLRNKLSRSETRAYIERQIAAWGREAEESTKRDLMLLARDGWTNLLEAPTKHAIGYQIAGRADLAPLLVALVGEKRVSTFLLADIDSVPEGLNKAARAARLEAIEAELLDLETQEEQLIEQCEEEGIPVQRRADARPEIVLGVPDPVVPKPYDRRNSDSYHTAGARVADSPYMRSIANANRN